MVQGKDRTKKINRIIMEGLDESIEDKKEILKLLASEKIKKRERQKEKIKEEINECFSNIEDKLWEDEEFIETMKMLDD